MSRLLPEFTRKGRIDEIFGLYLSTEGERRNVFAIHLHKRHRDLDQFNLGALSQATEGYIGAEVE